jgi:hypothetical protein
MFVIGRHITIWQRQQSQADLEEILTGAEVFHAIAKELKRRSQSVL